MQAEKGPGEIDHDDVIPRLFFVLSHRPKMRAVPPCMVGGAIEASKRPDAKLDRILYIRLLPYVSPGKQGFAPRLPDDTGPKRD